MRVKGCPYPKDMERKLRVTEELIKRNMTITALSKKLKICLPDISNVISGRRLSPITEEKIASYFGKKREELFPTRSLTELEAMRKREKRYRSAA